MSKPRKFGATLLLVCLIVGVAAAIVRSALDRQSTPPQMPSSLSAPALNNGLITVRGLVGSEKREFLTDPRVLDIFKHQGIDLQIETLGSREIVDRADDRGYDFGFPAGVPDAERLMAKLNVTRAYYPFYTPMVIASWVPIAQILAASGIVGQNGNSIFTVDTKRLLDAIEGRRRWSQLAQNNAYNVDKSIIISSTDLRRSNSAEMYLALASFIENGSEIVSSDEQARNVAPKVADFFTRQGYQGGPFYDYTSIGMGKVPLVICYESQFIEFQLAHPNDRDAQMVLLYPQPTVITKHVLVPMTPQGDTVGKLLETDPRLQELAVEHGLRIGNRQTAQAFWKPHGINVPDTIIDVVDTPNYRVFETLLKATERQISARY